MGYYFIKSLFFILFLTLCFNLAAQEKEVLYYKNGNIKAVGSFKNSIKTGKWIYYFPNGNPSSEEYYEDGNLDGLISYFYQDGQLMAKELWEDGLQQDSSVYYHNPMERKGSLIINFTNF
jgi:antitoxin component YwqK of YwqJK toxin-antitoxin module